MSLLDADGKTLWELQANELPGPVYPPGWFFTQTIESTLDELTSLDAIIPFTEEMLREIPFTADSQTAEQVPNGEDIEGPTLEATQILKQCRRRMKEDEAEITLEEIRSGFKV